MNLDDISGGTHWTAINTKKKLYFDGYSQPKPNIVPNDYRESKLNFEIQSINSFNSTSCGGLSVLWLWYVNYSTERKFYSLYKDVYRNV